MTGGGGNKQASVCKSNEWKHGRARYVRTFYVELPRSLKVVVAPPRAISGFAHRKRWGAGSGGGVRVRFTFELVKGLVMGDGGWGMGKGSEGGWKKSVWGRTDVSHFELALPDKRTPPGSFRSCPN